jgi:hypothetical protein
MRTWIRWHCYVTSVLIAWLYLPLTPWLNALQNYFHLIQENDAASYPEISYNVEAVLHQALALPSHSWEYGTAAEALLEYESPHLSVFGLDPFPNGRIPKVDWKEVRALLYVKPFITVDGTTLFAGDSRLSYS